MKSEFNVIIERFEQLSSMPESWPSDHLRELLRRLEVDGLDSVGDGELREFAVMALQDHEVSEAAKVVLAQTLGKLMTAGQIQNLAEEMKEDRKWEEASDMRTHEPIFNAQDLLSEAFPQDYATPDVVRITAAITATSQASAALLKEPVPEALLVRLLSDGLPESAVLKRLFDEALDRGPFPEASQILWQYSTTPREPGPGIRVTLYAPKSWFGPLEDVESYESDAFPDALG